MRRILKITLFPIRLALTILVALCRLICMMSGIALTGIALLAFAIGMASLIFLQDTRGAVPAFTLAFLFSPFGLSGLATLLTELLAALNGALKAV